MRGGRRGCSGKKGGWFCITCVFAELDAAHALQQLPCICMEDTLKNQKTVCLGVFLELLMMPDMGWISFLPISCSIPHMSSHL